MCMKIDSCKKCGNVLEISHTCLVCEEPNKFECTHCNIVFDEQFHTQCVLWYFFLCRCQIMIWLNYELREVLFRKKRERHTTVDLEWIETKKIGFNCYAVFIIDHVLKLIVAL